MNVVPQAPLHRDLRRLLSVFGRVPPPVARPALALVAGLPGTGKTTFSHKVATLLPAMHISSDRVRRALFRSPTYSAAESAIVFRRAHELAELLLRQGTPVVFDATSLQDWQREPLYAIAGRTGAPLLIVWMDAPEDVVRERLAARRRQRPGGESDADWQVYEKMRPDVEPVLRPHLVVDSSQETGTALRRALAAMRGEK